MADLEVVLKGFVGWLEKRNGDVFYVVTRTSNEQAILTLGVADDFVLGVAVQGSQLVLAAANPEDDNVELKKPIGAKFRNPEALGIEICKHLLSFAAEANRLNQDVFEGQLIESAAEMALSIGSDLYAGLAFMHMGIYNKDKQDEYFAAFLYSSAAANALCLADNDDMHSMSLAVREQCWEAYEPTVQQYLDLRSGMRDEFLAQAPSADANKLIELTGFYIRTIVPILGTETSQIEESSLYFLEFGTEGSELVSGALNEELSWELMLRDYSDDGPYWRNPRPTISDSSNPDETAFGFLLSLVLGGIENLPSSIATDLSTRTQIGEMHSISNPTLMQSAVLLTVLETTMGMSLVGLLEIVDGWEKLPQWFDESLLSEAINAYAETFENSFFLDNIFELASTAGFGYLPRG